MARTQTDSGTTPPKAPQASAAPEAPPAQPPQASAAQTPAPTRPETSPQPPQAQTRPETPPRQGPPPAPEAPRRPPRTRAAPPRNDPPPQTQPAADPPRPVLSADPVERERQLSTVRDSANFGIGLLRVVIDRFTPGMPLTPEEETQLRPPLEATLFKYGGELPPEWQLVGALIFIGYPRYEIYKRNQERARDTIVDVPPVKPPAKPADPPPAVGKV